MGFGKGQGLQMRATHTMAVKILTFGIAVYANVWVEAYRLAAPVAVEEGESIMHAMCAGEALIDSPQFSDSVIFQHDFFQSGGLPQSACKCRIIDLEPVIHTDRFSLLGP